MSICCYSLTENMLHLSTTIYCLKSFMNYLEIYIQYGSTQNGFNLIFIDSQKKKKIISNRNWEGFIRTYKCRCNCGNAVILSTRFRLKMGCSLHTSPSRGFKSFLYSKHFACIVLLTLIASKHLNLFNKNKPTNFARKWLETADLTSQHVSSHSVRCGLKAPWLRVLSLMCKAPPVYCTRSSTARPLQVKRGTAH